MLMDLVETLVTAGEDAGETEKAYKALEKVGVGTKCYLALTAIVSGEKLVPGRNCEEINVAEALNALNA